MNALKNENSPYLLQHANNPVNWHPWNDEVLEYAREHNKLLIISIGYAACHWCHVMERESFEDKEVAEIMNRHFVCIKVDREERPDVDQVYMEAVQLITGRGGWPLNAFALPDGRPFYAGTYFPKEQWISVLQQIVELRDKQNEKLEQHAKEVTRGFQKPDEEILHASPGEFGVEELNAAIEKWSRRFDHKWGGTAGAPKFPMPSTWEFLMHLALEFKDEKLLTYINTSLLRMANGGIYDHVGGGFARYSVDEKWHVPHFEKMLYDNAQLVSLYSHAYQYTKNELFKERIIQTLDFIEHELKSPEGGFYSSLDADSEGKEGKYYTWTKDEIVDILGDSSQLFCEYYSVESSGNWEHAANVLWIQKEKQQLCEKYDILPDDFDINILNSLLKLKKSRELREKPALDDKILTSWNALMISAYVDAYCATGFREYLGSAQKTIFFIRENLMKKDYRIDRSYKNGKSDINAFLDDYALLIQALIKMYQACFYEDYLKLANNLVNYVSGQFSSSDKVFFNYKSKQDKQLIAEKRELDDNVIPSSNSVMAKNLFLLGHYYENRSMTDRSALMVSGIKSRMFGSPAFYSNWADLYLTLAFPLKEIVITGPNVEKLRKEFSGHYLPGVIMAGADKDSGLEVLKGRVQNNEDQIYVCVNKSCNMPVSTVDEALSLLKDN